MVAAAAVLLTTFLQAPRTLRAQFGDVPVPPHSYYRPGVPLEAFSYTKQTVSAEPQPESSDDTTPKQPGKKETQPRVIHSGKIALAALNRPGEPQNAPSNQSASVNPVAQLPARNQ